jgi:hypothetical protein
VVAISALDGATRTRSVVRLQNETNGIAARALQVGAVQAWIEAQEAVGADDEQMWQLQSIQLEPFRSELEDALRSRANRHATESAERRLAQVTLATVGDILQATTDALFPDGLPVSNGVHLLWRPRKKGTCRSCAHAQPYMPLTAGRRHGGYGRRSAHGKARWLTQRELCGFFGR